MFQFVFALIFLLVSNRAQLLSQSHVAPLAQHEFSLNDRYGNPYVNNVFKDNILLTLSYIVGDKINPSNINWGTIEKPASYKLVLKPGETFAFHDDVLPTYNGKVAKTTNAHFDSSEGYKSDGYLVGDGVCHLASLLYWVASDAGLATLAPTRHDFAPVPEVPREFGVSIYDTPGKNASSQSQNLYITNNREKPVTFVFEVENGKLKISVEESSS